jgi:hypothetical protein
MLCVVSVVTTMITCVHIGMHNKEIITIIPGMETPLL